jgi:7-keto-8-aminopelargonate synthetase-like enzyme
LTLLVKSELFAFNPDYPIIYPDIQGINERLTANNIIITNFKYSTGGKDLNRIIFTANHTEDDLNAVIRILNQYQF